MSFLRNGLSGLRNGLTGRRNRFRRLRNGFTGRALQASAKSANVGTFCQRLVQLDRGIEGSLRGSRIAHRRQNHGGVKLNVRVTRDLSRRLPDDWRCFGIAPEQMLRPR